MREVLAVVAAIPWGALWVATGLLGGLVGSWTLAGAGRQQVAQFAIMVAFKAARQLLGDGLQAVSDADLSAIAHSAYHALPAVMLVGPLPVPVGLLKMALSEDAFVGLVQTEYHRFRDAYAQALADTPPSGSPLDRPTPTPSPVRSAIESVQQKAVAARVQDQAPAMVPVAAVVPVINSPMTAPTAVAGTPVSVVTVNPGGTGTATAGPVAGAPVGKGG